MSFIARLLGRGTRKETTGELPILDDRPAPQVYTRPGFKGEAAAYENPELAARVQAAIQQHVWPMLAMHGGGCTVVDVTTDGVVSLRLQGACHGCSMSAVTLNQGIEQMLLAEVPGVTRVQAVGEPAQPVHRRFE
jgi:Fe-S cluster biogenesis protein NfuA